MMSRITHTMTYTTLIGHRDIQQVGTISSPIQLVPYIGDFKGSENSLQKSSEHIYKQLRQQLKYGCGRKGFSQFTNIITPSNIFIR